MNGDPSNSERPESGDSADYVPPSNPPSDHTRSILPDDLSDSTPDPSSDPPSENAPENRPLPVDLFASVESDEIPDAMNPSEPIPLRHGLPNLPTLEPIDASAPTTQPDDHAVARRTGLNDVAPSTRQIMLPWCMWLLGSWAVSLWMESPAAAIRWMLYSSLFGLMLAWPTFRLSQDGRMRNRRGDTSGGSHAASPEAKDARPPRKTVLTPGLIFRDWVSMNLVFQSVVWPLRITAGWELEQALWIDAAVASWSLLVGALTAWGCRYRNNGGRAWATFVVFLVMFGEPLLLSVIGILNEKFALAIPQWSMRLSPIETMYALTASSGLFEPGAWRFNIVSVAAAGLFAWMITLITWRGMNAHKPDVSRV